MKILKGLKNMHIKLNLTPNNKELIKFGLGGCQGQLDSCINPTWPKIPTSKLHGNVVSTSTPNDTKPFGFSATVV